MTTAMKSITGMQRRPQAYSSLDFYKYTFLQPEEFVSAITNVYDKDKTIVYDVLRTFKEEPK